MRYPKILVLALILLLLLLPAGVYAATDHSGHGDSIDNTSSPNMNMTGDNHDMNMAGNSPESHNQMTAPETEYKESSGNGGHDKHGASTGNEPSTGGGHESSGHNGGSEKSNLEPVKNNIVGGFAGLNALIIIAAAIMKMRYRQGV
jgi:hypothetical protein